MARGNSCKEWKYIAEEIIQKKKSSLKSESASRAKPQSL
jgi:hypothetical protein